MTRSGGWSPHEQGFVSALVRRDGRQDVPQPRESARKPGGGPSLRAGLRAPTPGLQSGEERAPVLDTAPREAVCRGGPNSALPSSDLRISRRSRPFPSDRARFSVAFSSVWEAGECDRLS